MCLINDNLLTSRCTSKLYHFLILIKKQLPHLSFLIGNFSTIGSRNVPLKNTIIMKINGLFTLLGFTLLFFTQQATAQLRLGVKAGANLSTTYGSPEEFNGENIEGIGFQPGFQVGAFVGLGITDGLKLMGEVAYEVRNGLKEVDVTIPTPAGNVTVSSDFENSFHYINIPILLVIGDGPIQFYGGPNFAILTKATASVSEENSATGDREFEIDFRNDPEYESFGSFINESDLGINLGLMLGLGESAFVDLRLNHGISDATNDNYDRSILDPTVSREDSDRNVSVQLSLGFAF